jgi:hypothetical protein
MSARVRWSGIGLLVMAACAAGCDWWRPAARDPNYDSSRAKEVLLDVLETWKRGKVGTLAGRTPPVRFVDDDYVAGFALLEYRLAMPEQAIAPYESVPVVMKIKSGREVIEKTAVYQVTLDPKIAVLRAE